MQMNNVHHLRTRTRKQLGSFAPGSSAGYSTPGVYILDGQPIIALSSVTQQMIGSSMGSPGDPGYQQPGVGTYLSAIGATIVADATIQNYINAQNVAAAAANAATQAAAQSQAAAQVAAQIAAQNAAQQQAQQQAAQAAQQQAATQAAAQAAAAQAQQAAALAAQQAAQKAAAAQTAQQQQLAQAAQLAAAAQVKAAQDYANAQIAIITAQQMQAQATTPQQAAVASTALQAAHDAANAAAQAHDAAVSQGGAVELDVGSAPLLTPIANDAASTTVGVTVAGNNNWMLLAGLALAAFLFLK